MTVVLKFLTGMFRDGASYSSLNLARSALSSSVVLSNGHQLGTESIICRFLKGVFNLRPPMPRYDSVWDVKPVLNYLRALSPVKFVSLKQLTLKLVCLMALVSAQRAQTLSMLHIDNMENKGKKVTFTLPGLIKQSRPGHLHRKIEFAAYPPDRRLCVCTVLKEYLARTRRFRKDQTLFISFKHPFSAVSKDTVSRWIRTVLGAAGIDIVKFKSHSTRAAASSAAQSKFVPIKEIMNTAGWSSEKTFQTFYSKPIEKNSNSFANSVLS